ncbi:MAG: haloacid dehalogenase type II [Leeuwenhoekiella sp.]|uniref:Haloacid dehalogenase type II n=1 Tax=Leeuwenhoekiella nanhaiensis TaxID=1655491 RepID=A0A2G1VQX7_9FLAO|nr:haloacid dehalogenase type II [Leeuwenhoekiella nanhaiensis]PHQ29163.1 haloacid dehalogenase type II [Leeuwenhoekiella nanhaiensis]PHR98662.1 MAG: haloacid dehalogenase type II [Leeuwenhoekiella sp.]
MKPKLILFDVNETLLDLKPLARRINTTLSNNLAFDLWFSSLLHYSLVETTTGNHEDFSKIAKATFEMTALKFKKVVPEEEIESILGLIKKLPPHPDTVEALQVLKQKGFRMAALTNGNPTVAQEQLAFAEIKQFFERIFSVDEAGAFKPNPKPYIFVLDQLKVKPQETMMVAAHGWDITGARRAGLQTAFIARDGKFKYPLAEAPTFDCKDLKDLVKRLS